MLFANIQLLTYIVIVHVLVFVLVLIEIRYFIRLII